ncbi:hypothetical protein TNCV_1470181 [Trichonephila clavipes]|nr:hypothetical protein TNCV_1470181 [Trichonephila clavipes]
MTCLPWLDALTTGLPQPVSRAETFSCWCGVVVRRGGCQLRCRPRHLTMVQITWSVAKSPRVAEQCDVNIKSINQSSQTDNLNSTKFLSD